jgi:hypothetical protein
MTTDRGKMDGQGSKRVSPAVRTELAAGGDRCAGATVARARRCLHAAGPAAAVVTVLLVLALASGAAARIAIGLVLLAFGATVAGAFTLAIAAGLLNLCWSL